MTTVTPLSTAPQAVERQRLEEGNKQESEKAEAIYYQLAVGVGWIGVGMKTDRIRTDITDIIFIFIFLVEFGFEHG